MRSKSRRSIRRRTKRRSIRRRTKRRSVRRRTKRRSVRRRTKRRSVRRRTTRRRIQSGGTDWTWNSGGGSTPAPVEVHQWLTEQGKTKYAVSVCKAFRDAGYPPTEWLTTLKKMSKSPANNAASSAAGLSALDELLKAVEEGKEATALPWRGEAVVADEIGIDGVFLPVSMAKKAAEEAEAAGKYLAAAGRASRFHTPITAQEVEQKAVEKTAEWLQKRKQRHADV